MADTHLQINADGSTVMRKTVLWPSSTNGREEVLKSLFSRNNWEISRIFNVSGSHWKVEVSCQDISYRINLYIGSVRDEARQEDEFKMQLGGTYPTSEEEGWITLILGIYAISNDTEEIVDYILSAYNNRNFDFSGNPSIRGTRTKGLQLARILGFYKTDKSYLFRPDFLYYYIQNQKTLEANHSVRNALTTQVQTQDNNSYLPYLTALRTKPFMLLAGISGTGKSRIVRELAFKSCPSYLQDEDGTTPGNYCMIEVKPNWHDSSELLGYYSNIAKQYVFTDFVKFLLKAKLYSDVPFFVCMDEMNLAPVEQYFAEFLSVLETRKQTDSGIKTGALVKGHYFKRIKSVNEYDNVQTDADVYTLLEIPITAEQKEELSKTNSLKTDGLTLPENVFVIGTVNMDDTTHQFSRKVLDRAMTIEMNGGELKDMFGHSSDLEYLPEENVWKIDQFKPKHVNADEVLEEHIDSNGDLDETGIAFKTQLADKLDAINQVLKDTPFVVSYRVLNELVIYAGVLLDDGKETEEAINDAVDQITLMKILPRIEGDEDLLGNAKDENNRLCQLMKVVGPKSQAKIKEMNRRLESGFTRFWP